MKFWFFAPKSSNPPKHRCENRDLRIEISVRFNSGIFKLQSLCSHGNRYFYPLGSALVRWICWEIFSLWDPWRCWGWVRRKTGIIPYQPIRRICRNLEFVPLSTRQKKTILGMLQPNSQWVLVPLSKIHQKTKTSVGKNFNFSFSVLLLEFLLWDELYGLSWNSRNWKKWGKRSQILNAITLSRPKRVFFSGKLFILSCFCSVKSHNHLLPDIVCWLGSCYNNFSRFSDLLCIVILFFLSHWRWTTWWNSSKNSKKWKKIEILWLFHKWTCW